MNPIEKKTAASTSIGGLITLVFLLAGQYHWFTPPSSTVTAAIVAAAAGLAGWLAPHTSRTPPAPAPVPPTPPQPEGKP